MSQLLLKNATIVTSNGSDHPQDVLITNGTIERIAPGIEAEKAETITSDHLMVSSGWFDLHVNFRDPGFEYKEDLTSGTQAAARGGFTGVACMPATHPVVDSKSGVDYIRNATRDALVDVHPIGALSKARNGKELSELYDMHQAGAIAFSDDKRTVHDTDLLKRALLYCRDFNGLVMHYPNDPHLSGEGKMNEGVMSTQLGLKGMPALAEEINVARDLALLEYTGGRLHFSTISTAGSVELIRQAKQRGLAVSAEVAAHNLVLNDEALDHFDTNYKVLPPLRTAADQEALKAGLLDGTIDAICSDHQPENEENKKRELDHASFGMTGLETAFAVVNMHLGDALSVPQLVNVLSWRPREILGLPVPAIAAGEPANLTVFDPTLGWTYATSSVRSKSYNSPFLNQQLTGKVLAVVNNGSYECF
ncbi:MAG: dihydroorotase [Bacteroidota bacterium]